MPDPAEMIMPMLREMRAEITARFDGVDDKIERVDRRLKKLEEAQNSYRQALTADTLMSRLLTASSRNGSRRWRRRCRSWSRTSE